MGKSYDGWLPLGPCLVSTSILTPEKAQNLSLRTSLSTHPTLLQDGSTKDQLWQIAETVSALSYGTTLRKGDIICTGTPDGQGSNRKPPVWLQDAQTVIVSADYIGSLVNEVKWEKVDSYSASTTALAKAKL